LGKYLEKELSIIKKIPDGYKQTEIGVIPEDWDVVKLNLLANDIGDGIHSTPKYVDSSNYFFVNGNNLSNGRILVTQDTKCINKDEYELLKKNLDNTTILMSINGTIGNLAFFNNETVVLGKSAAYIKLSQRIDKIFIYYLLQHSSIKKFYDNELTGTTIKNLSLSSIRITPIPIPPSKSEQTAIATVLSDTDALIEHLKKLISKKKAIKQGAMQQLLTGKKRLPGFNGEWKVKKLGEVAEIKKGQLITDRTRINGSIPVIAGGKALAYYHNKANRRGKTITVSGSGVNAGYVAFHTKPIFASDCSTIEESKNYSIEFIYFLLQSLQEKIYKMQTGGAQPHIHPSDLNPIIVAVPKPEEQTAIANILFDMDAEIEKLEQKRNKYIMLKQGMMQQLLTGRIRIYANN